MLHDALDRIGYVQDETGGKLPLGLSGVDQARCVRDELAGQHDVGHVRIESVLFCRVRFGL